MKTIFTRALSAILAFAATYSCARAQGPIGWDLNVTSTVPQSVNSATAAGWAALANGRTGNFNSGYGFFALFENRAGVANSGFGYAAGANNQTGIQNTAIGADALYWNTGSNNAAIGKSAIRGGTASGLQTLTQNSALGVEALYDLRNGSTGNIGIGFRAGFNLQTGSNNIYIGNNAGPTAESGFIRIGTPGTHTTTLLSGNVGVGTTTPGVALDVVGTTLVAVTGAGSFLNSGAQVPFTGTTNVSIRASGEINALIFNAVSDERIKTIKGSTNNAADLRTLCDIQITDYIFKDVITNGNRPQKKVIAQQVEKVFPQAVSIGSNVVPDIFEKANVKDGWVELVTNLKVGEKVRLITDKGEQKLHEVVEVKDGKFRTNLSADLVQVFVYGREVKDFRAVDYEAISMLNVSATQELARKLAAKDAEIAALKQQVAAHAAKDKAIEARLALLEQATSGSARAVKVAMTK